LCFAKDQLPLQDLFVSSQPSRVQLGSDGM
jgi:hypothetical protein